VQGKLGTGNGADAALHSIICRVWRSPTIPLPGGIQASLNWRPAGDLRWRPAVRKRLWWGTDARACSWMVEFGGM